MAAHTQHTDAAWAAGLFEGEGSIYVKALDGLRDRKTRRFTLSLSITNSELALLERFLRWGGRIRAVRGTALTRKQCYAWCVDRRAAALFLMDIVPYLRGKKREKARLAIQFQARLQPTRRRRESNGRIGLTSAEELAWRQRARELISA